MLDVSQKSLSWVYEDPGSAGETDNLSVDGWSEQEKWTNGVEDYGGRTFQKSKIL